MRSVSNWVQSLNWGMSQKINRRDFYSYKNLCGKDSHKNDLKCLLRSFPKLLFFFLTFTLLLNYIYTLINELNSCNELLICDTSLQKVFFLLLGFYFWKLVKKTFRTLRLTSFCGINIPFYKFRFILFQFFYLLFCSVGWKDWWSSAAAQANFLLCLWLYKVAHKPNQYKDLWNIETGES